MVHVVQWKLVILKSKEHSEFNRLKKFVTKAIAMHKLKNEEQSIRNSKPNITKIRYRKVGLFCHIEQGHLFSIFCVGHYSLSQRTP